MKSCSWTRRRLNPSINIKRLVSDSHEFPSKVNDNTLLMSLQLKAKGKDRFDMPVINQRKAVIEITVKTTMSQEVWNQFLEGLLHDYQGTEVCNS